MRYNPFNAQIPARPEYFVGRDEEILTFERNVLQTVHSSPTNMCIIGNRGIGKTSLLARYSEKYKADVGNIWHSDETTVFIKKDGEKKYYQWIWNVMDAKTRYLLACEVTETRYVKDARKPLKIAKEAAPNVPDAIVTDGLQAYREAIKAEYYGLGRIQNPHIRLKDFETKPNNNILERLNGTFRERTKVMRSLDSALGAGEFAAGMQTYYNYIRPHMGIDGMTPAQMANIPINLSGNRWETMIGLAITK